MDLFDRLDALLITNPTNIRYLTGFEGSAPEEREAYVLLTASQTFLFTNALYLEQAKKTKATVVEISREDPFAKKLGDVLKRSHLAKPQGETLKEIRLGFEETDLTVAEYHKIMHVHKNVMLVPTTGRVEELRMIKRRDEIENIRAAAKLTDQCFKFLLKKIKPGVTEAAIAWEIESFIRTRGAKLAFSPIAAFGKNASQPHYQPKSSLKRPRLLRLKKQDIVLLDFGAKVNGYCSDMTRVVFVGNPKDESRRAYETVLAAQQAALNYLNSPCPPLNIRGGWPRQAWPGGVTGARADRIARTLIEKAGFPPYPHSLGHGVGLDIHEAPRLTIKKDTILKPNMVITVEPGIYVEGSYGIRIEDLVLLKQDGIELLSKSKKEMIIL